jgi:large subunit ribosomal protein L17
MRHQRSGKKLGRDSAHRKALYANLTGALIEHGRIRTTVTKAKAVKPLAEQMITLARRGDLHARRQAVAFLRSKDVVHKLFAEVAPRFEGRPGGYARIVRIGPRPGDAAEMAYLELVDSPLVLKTRLPRQADVEEADELDEEAAEDEVEEPEAEAEVAADEEEAADEEIDEAEPDADAEADVATDGESPADEEPASDEADADEPDSRG